MLRLAELQKKKNQEIETKESRNKLFLIANICFAICMATSTICTTIIIIELLAKWFRKRNSTKTLSEFREQH